MESHGVELGRWIRAKRATVGLTQEGVAERMGMEVDANYIAQVESGRKKALPDTEILIGLAQAFNVTVTEVLRGAGVLPVDVEQPMAHAPGSATIHALVDMIDWVRDPNRREAAESLLRTFLDQDQRASRPTSTSGAGRAQR